MSDNEKRYAKNAETCRAVGHFLEVLRENAKQFKKYDQVKYLAAIKAINESQEELNNLYDEQINLFDHVQQERRWAEETAIAKANRILTNTLKLEIGQLKIDKLPIIKQKN